MNFILCDYVFRFSIGLVLKMISILSQQFCHFHPYKQFGHFHPYKSKDNSFEQEFLIHLGLRLSYLGHPNEIETLLVNGVTSSGYYFVVWSYANSLYKIPSLARHLYEHVGSLRLYQIQSGSYL